MKAPEDIKNMILEYGASKSGIIDVADIVFDRELRKACEVNYCGNYGKNWACPPHIGEIGQLIEKTKKFNKAIVYQIVGNIEDSFDYNGMQIIKKNHDKLTRKIFSYCKENCEKFMLLSAGDCQYCERCQLKDNKICISPDNAIASLEAHGIFVSNLAQSSDMKYINGKNTVTYFGAIFLK